MLTVLSQSRWACCGMRNLSHVQVTSEKFPKSLDSCLSSSSFPLWLLVILSTNLKLLAFWTFPTSLNQHSSIFSTLRKCLLLLLLLLCLCFWNVSHLWYMIIWSLFWVMELLERKNTGCGVRTSWNEWCAINFVIKFFKIDKIVCCSWNSKRSRSRLIANLSRLFLMWRNGEKRHTTPWRSIRSMRGMNGPQSGSFRVYLSRNRR